MPAVPAPAPPPPPPPNASSATAQAAGAAARQKLAANAGYTSTIATSPGGLTTPNTDAPKSLLGA